MKDMGEQNVNTQSAKESDSYERDVNARAGQENISYEQDLYERDLSGQPENEEVTDNKHKKANGRKRKSGAAFRKCLTFVQHLLLACAAVSTLLVITGSTVIINGTSYMLDPSDSGVEYEDSDLFDMLYGQSVADIIRFGVIRSQLETDGEFDGNKIVDVTAYNYRNIGIPERYVTAKYYLEDLLKWYKYGMEYSSEYMSSLQLDSFLSDKTMVTIMDPDSKYYNTSDANYMKSNIGNYTFVDDVSANMLPMDGSYDDYDYAYSAYYDEYGNELDDYGNVKTVAVDVLINRYKTVDGKNIESYTADLPSYRELCSNVATAIENLNINYEEYLEFKDYYDKKNTNVLYCIEKTIDGHTEYYTNMEDYIGVDGISATLGNKNGNMAEFFSENLNGMFDIGRYLYYSPSEMIYETDSAVSEATINSIVRQYDYAYPENIRIWIGVDTSYPVKDAFMQGKTGYQNYVPHFWQSGVLAVFSLIIYFMLFIYLTMTAGRESDEDGNTVIELTEFDKSPTEFALFICLSVVIVLLCGVVCVHEFGYIYRNYIYDIYVRYTDGLVIGAGVLVFLLDMLFCFFYYSFIRRIKGRVIWKNSYLRRLMKKAEGLALELYGNSSIVIRVWVPFIIFLLFNLMMALLGPFGIAFAFVIDMLIGVMMYKDAKERQNIVSGIEKIAQGDLNYQVEQERMHGDNIVMAQAVNSIGNGIKNAVEASMKDERMKTELITNVSHDIKTPLTSIINYVDLVKREDVDNERVRSYIKVLDEKSQRLKQLIDDLVEASKISSGNINLNFEKINLTELLNQTIGEFSEKFEQKGLSIVMNGNASNVVIEADSRSIFRVIENLFNNVYKYALERTRVYVSINCIGRDGIQVQEMAEIIIKNISASELNCNPEELTERFIRGDESRTTEGSGLGLSIAKNLTEAQNGTFEIQLDGDLFKVILTFPIMQN